MGHTMVFATETSSDLATKYCNFANFKTIFHTRISIIQMEPNVIKVGSKMDLKPNSTQKYPR